MAKNSSIVKTAAEATALVEAYDPDRDPRVFQAEAKHWREGVEFACELANARLGDVHREGIREPVALIAILAEISTRLNQRLEALREELPKVKAAAIQNLRELAHREAANYQLDQRVEALRRASDEQIQEYEAARAAKLAGFNAERLQALEKRAQQAQAELNAMRQMCGGR